MKIVICDDNKLFGRWLKEDIQEYFAEKEILDYELEVFTSGEEFIEKDIDVDIAFLDVLMGEISGIELANILYKKNSNIIIFMVTNYDEYLDDAMDANIYRYFTKPVKKERLFRNLEKAIKKYNDLNHSYTIRTKTGIAKVLSGNIICVETVGRKTIMHTTDGEYECSQDIAYWAKELNFNGFYHTYRSYVVNMKYAYKIVGDIVYLRHNNWEKRAYIARRKQRKFKEAFAEYLGCQA